MRVLVTGVAGFIGMHVAARLLERGDHVIGIDTLNDYYDVQLKWDRLGHLLENERFVFSPTSIADARHLADLFAQERPTRVVNLAAQAGVRYSIENPSAYVDSNLVGFANILEQCRQIGVEHLVYASSSSVYGANARMPFAVDHGADHPVSLYAATKRANELMAHAYSHLFSLPTTGLRFFTVYGPWGRPDMALFKFTRAIIDGDPIDLYNFGAMRRDFTYVGDIVEGVIRLLDRVPEPNDEWSGLDPDPASSRAPYRIFNIGNNRPVELSHLVAVLEECIGDRAIINLLPMQPGDVEATFADIEALDQYIGFRPSTTIEDGVARFVDWYTSYYGTPRPSRRRSWEFLFELPEAARPHDRIS